MMTKVDRRGGGQYLLKKWWRHMWQLSNIILLLMQKVTRLIRGVYESVQSSLFVALPQNRNWEGVYLHNTPKKGTDSYTPQKSRHFNPDSIHQLPIDYFFKHSITSNFRYDVKSNNNLGFTKFANANITHHLTPPMIWVTSVVRRQKSCNRKREKEHRRKN